MWALAKHLFLCWQCLKRVKNAASNTFENGGHPRGLTLRKVKYRLEEQIRSHYCRLCALFPTYRTSICYQLQCQLQIPWCSGFGLQRKYSGHKHVRTICLVSILWWFHYIMLEMGGFSLFHMCNWTFFECFSPMVSILLVISSRFMSIFQSKVTFAFP